MLLGICAWPVLIEVLDYWRCQGAVLFDIRSQTIIHVRKIPAASPTVASQCDVMHAVSEQKGALVCVCVCVCVCV